jgi:hypothetical protein
MVSRARGDYARITGILTMKSLIPVFAIVLGLTAAVTAEQPGTLTTLEAIHSLTNEDAGQPHAVVF